MNQAPSDYRNLLRPNHPHYQLINWITPGSRVADIGCGYGDLSACLENYKSCQVFAVEPSPDRARAASAKRVSVFTGSIEASETWEWLGKDYDAIIFADVLEHLVNPESVLLECKRHLSRGGVVLVSLPNIAHFSIRLRLGVGRFDYNQSGGLLDSTHLRFFVLLTTQ